MTRPPPSTVPAADSGRDVGIQTALILALVNGAELRVLNASEKEVELESADPLPAEFSLSLAVFSLTEWAYAEFRFDKSRIVSRKSLEYSELCRVVLGDAASKGGESYAECVAQLKSLWRSGPQRDGSVACGEGIRPNYALMEVKRSFATYEERRRSWFGVDISAEANTAFSQLAAQVQHAFSVRTPSGYEMLLELGFEKTVARTLEELDLAGHGLFSASFERLYVGNEFCPHLFPSVSQLLGMLDSGRAAGLELTVVCPYLIEHTVEEVKHLLATLDVWNREHGGKMEIVVNDWGCLDLLQSHGPSLTPTLGKLLNKRKKDPRVKWYWGYAKHESDLQQNNLNVGWYREFLRDYGLERFEFEAGPIRSRIPNVGHSLHYPYYYTNASVFCMLHAEVTEFYAGKQKLVKKCPRYCSEFCYLYPDHLNLVGKGNAIFGFNDRILSDPESLRDYVDQGIDRLVFMPDC